LTLRANRRLYCLTLAAITIVVGLIWRLALLGLPQFLYKYGGSVLWAAMVYWVGAALLPGWRPLRLAMAACAVAAVVELSRRHHTPGLDAFRLTLAGRLLLGRVFSVWDILAYWIAIATAASVDQLMAGTER
jgi:hypothetical protein